MKKIINLLIGTNNSGKLREIRELLPKYTKTFSTSDFDLKSPKEKQQHASAWSSACFPFKGDPI